MIKRLSSYVKIKELKGSEQRQVFIGKISTNEMRRISKTISIFF